MYIEKISASSYNTEGECQAKYYIDKILKHRFPGKYIATPKGSITHHVLECLALAKLAYQNGEKTISDEVLGEKWPFSWPIDNVVIDGIIDCSYEHFKKIEHHFEWTDEDKLEVKKWVYSVLEYRGGEYNPLNREIVAVEKDFDLPIKEEWACITEGVYFSVNGFIDLITKIDGGIEIIDYKTGSRKDYSKGRKKTYEDFMEDIQLLIYRYAAAILFPQEDHFMISIFYIKDGGVFSMVYDDSDINKLILKIKAKYNRIKNTKNPTFNKTFSCKHICDYSCNTFEKPLIEFRHGKFASIGQPMKVCDEVQYAISKHGIEFVEKTYKKVK